MNFIITKPFSLLTVLREFNPELTGKHIRIKGVTQNGNYLEGTFLVQNVDFWRIDLVDLIGNKHSLYTDDFYPTNHDYGVKLISILEEESA